MTSLRSMFVLIVALGWLPSPAAADETLVGYLQSTGRPADFASRKVLWLTFRPGEKYLGTADQNIAFLKAIKTQDQAPRLELAAETVGSGETVKAKVVSTGPVLIESDLRAQSFNAQPDEQVDLGVADAVNVRTVRITNGTSDRVYLIWITPTEGGKLSLLATEATSAPFTENLTPAPAPSEGIVAALEKFAAWVDGERFQQKLKAQWPQWLAENTGALGETLVVYAVGGPIACGGAGAAQGIGLTIDVLSALVDDSDLTAEEKMKLKTFFAVSGAAVSLMSPSLETGKHKALCKIAEVGLSLADSGVASTEFENAGVKVSARLFLQSGKKFVMVLCAKKLQ